MAFLNLRETTGWEKSWGKFGSCSRHRLDAPGVSRNLTSMHTVISSKGQVVLPATLRQRDRIAAGQKFDIERLDAGQYLLKRHPVPDNDGLVDWLLACPEKDWFQPVASESTDSL